MRRAIDRRQHHRARDRLPIRLSSIDPDTDPWTGRPFFRACREVCGNLSRTGVFVRTLDPPSPGQRVWLELELPEGGPFETIGRVAWSRSATAPHARGELGVGIRFVRTTVTQATRLEQFLDRTLSRS